ncbi:MAG: ammonia-forming cytochrome c nitrite reductase subunit c552 [Myxococcales bacterium]|nr:ammonia-forming cytochrome c nitrite reductase subunit c552 [Myxococcales bacterium]
MTWLFTLLPLLLELASHGPADAPKLVDVNAWRTIGRVWFAGGDAYLTTASVDSLSENLRNCANCHSEVASEWRPSLHAHAWLDPIFQTAYAKEPDASCRHCHAPMGDPNGTGKHLAADGISCASCHVRNGTILGPTARAKGIVGHVVVAAPDMHQAGYCGGCHQFGFVAHQQGKRHGTFETTDFQQSTYAEWSQSAHAAQGTQCQDCHMPTVKRATGKMGASHRFIGAEPEAIARAVQLAVTATTTSDVTQVSVQIRATGAGHAFPTGDLHRRARLRIWCAQQPETVQQIILGRSFEAYRGVYARRGPFAAVRTTADTRVPPTGTATYSARLPPCATVGYSLDYDNMPIPDAKLAGADKPWKTIAVAQGQVQASAGSPPASIAP